MLDPQHVAQDICRPRALLDNSFPQDQQTLRFDDAITATA